MERYVADFGMLPHPEGGYYVSTYRNDIVWHRNESPIVGDDRPLATAIYYLLPSGQVSRFHSLQSDEIWFFHDGCPLVIHTFSLNNEYKARYLGLDTEKGHQPQVLITPHTVFGAEPLGDDSFSLVSCVVSPGFDFSDFTFADKELLKSRFPEQAGLIDRIG